MHPFLGVLRVGAGERPVGTYGAMLALAVLVVGAGVVRAAHRDGRDIGKVFAALAIAVGGGFVGAWTTFALVEWARTGSPAAAWQGGGLVFFGAIPGAAIAVAIAERGLRVGALRVIELALPSLAVGHALGRLGCFFGGCCYGRPFDGAWAVLYTHPFAPGAHPSVPRHPTPLYEAAGLLAIGLAFGLVRARRPGDGRRALVYLAAYASLRLVVELFRGDARRGLFFGGVSTSQIIAGVALVLAGVVLIRRRGPAPA